MITSYSTRHGMAIVGDIDAPPLLILSEDISWARVAQGKTGVWDKDFTAEMPDDLRVELALPKE